MQNIKKKIKQKRLTEEFRVKRRANNKKRMQDPIKKIRANISTAIGKALRKGKTNKAGYSIMKYLGYDMNILKEHLTNQFDSNMNWENYGTYWHIDHIIPQSDLPYKSMEDENFKICWSLNNLRPLEARQNMKDGGSKIRHKKK